MKYFLTLILAMTGICQAQDWQPIFNGKDLTGWSGDPRLWKVENGTIIGETDKAGRAIKANTFLIYEAMQPGDFDLEFSAKVTGNNSGVQYRSKRPDPKGWVLKGYQFDLHPKAEYLGMLYEEGGRGISCKRGEIVELDNKPKVTGKLKIEMVDLAKWNTYRIETRGNVAKHYVNGELAAEIHDVNAGKRALEGFIGLQLHAGPAMKAEFKDIRYRSAKASGTASAKDMSDTVTLLPGFKLERIYEVPKNQGSWVSITSKGDGVYYCSDQHGRIYRVELKENAGPEIHPASFELSGAHGLLWHDGILWVSVNEARNASGVWKVTDSDGDGEPDKPERIKAMQGSGEHGPHSLVASPDGKWIYFVAGNHTKIPEFDSSLVPQVWEEDQLLPRRPDSRGHASRIMAPGGWVARFRPTDNHWQLFSIGYRNTFDIAFNPLGDLFAYDSDMEWDLGMPWYRPTRICQVTPGSEFGWRNGTGKWPESYEDSMPTLLDIGPGSPTGLISGHNSNFPEKYQKALYAFDWTFATIYAIHLTPDGAGYRAEREEFLAGKGMPLSHATIADDGSMIFLTGGRKSGSAMWRISYTGEKPDTHVTFENKEFSHYDTDTALDKINSKQRIERHQARVALELEGPDTLLKALKPNAQAWSVITASIGLARTGSDAQMTKVIDALDQLKWDDLDTAQKVNWLRATGLVFIRHGKPDEATREKVLAKINQAFPSGDQLLDRELCRMLSYLQAPGIVSRTLDAMDTAEKQSPPDWVAIAKRNDRYGKAIIGMIENLPPAQVIHYIYCLREVKGPWTEQERQRFFAWFPKLLTRKGGHSYGGFITDLRAKTLESATSEERPMLEQLIQSSPTPNVLANLPTPKGPGRVWTADDVVRIAAAGFDGADREHGKKMYQAALCASCHRFGGEGGAAGPDLSTVAGRFTARDLAESILEPSKIVSDQYEFSRITKTDGSIMVGKVIEDTKDSVKVAFNAFDLSQSTAIPKKDVKEISPSPTSPMPAGLIHALNENELRDLLAYLLSQ